MNNPSIDINALPVELLPIIFSNLENKNLAVCESVCSKWQTQIQEVWKTKFEEMNLPISEETTSKLDKKSYVFALKGFVEVDFREYIRPLNPYFESGLPFGEDMEEPFVPVTVWNDESVDEFKKNPENCKKYGLQGTWHGGYSKLSDQSFPRRLPLKFFINKNGDYLKKGEPIQLLFNGKKIVLITNFKETRVDGTTIPSLEEGLARSVRVSLSTKHIYKDQVAKAINSAINNKEEWMG